MIYSTGNERSRIEMEEFGFQGHRERLRKRYMERGFSSLQEYEVLELLLTYVLPRRDTKMLAKKMLQKFGNLDGVLKAEIEELIKIGGIKERTAGFFHLLGDLEKEIFRSRLEISDAMQIRRKDDLISYLRAQIGFEHREKFMVLFLNTANVLVATEELFQGSLDRSAVYPREILEKVLKYQAKSVIFAHNHPSGNTKASLKDIELTREMKEALQMFDVLLLEHIIVSKNSYFSFLEEGLL